MSYFMKQKVGGKIFTSYWKIFVLNFSAKGNMAFFWAKKLMEKMIFTNYGKVLVLKFSVVGKTVVFESRSWWKDDIYWLQKSSCFEIFGGGKYGLFLEPRSWWKDDTYWLPRSSCFELSVMGNTIYFLAKNLMERWYLLSLFELFMIFQDLENTVLHAVIVVIPHISMLFSWPYCPNELWPLSSDIKLLSKSLTFFLSRWFSTC